MSPPWQALVLAGDRGAADPVAAHFGVPCKALAPLAGRPLLAWVLDALRASGGIDGVLLVGPRPEHLVHAPWLKAQMDSGAVRWMAPAAGAAASAVAGLAALPAGPVLVTTADHGLLDAAIVRAFLDAAQRTPADAAIGLALHARVMQAFPGTRRTRIALRDGGLCGCNLFALRTARGRDAAAFWQRMEAVRKRPDRIARLLGIGTLARYAAGRLDRAGAFAALGRLAGAEIAPVLLDAAHAAVDVDSLADHALAQAWRERCGATDPGPP